MPEVLEEEISTDKMKDEEWPNSDWHDWKTAIKTNSDKTEKQYLRKQIKEAVDWYCRMFNEEIPEYDINKELDEYDAETIEKIDQALSAYLTHTDEASGLTGSDDFARRHLMYRGDLNPEEIKKRYIKWEENEKKVMAAKEA